MAIVSSNRGGALSIGSSVTLKSPSRKSGRRSLLERLSSSISVQNCWCAGLPLGAYMFSNVVFSFSSHSTCMANALPAFSSKTSSFLGAIKVLFITKATPAVAWGAFGSSELYISIFLLKQPRMVSKALWSRCVSWSAKIAILYSFSVWFIMDHLPLAVSPCVGAVSPFILSIAMFMFARRRLWVSGGAGISSSAASPGVGGRWCASRGASPAAGCTSFIGPS